MSSSIGSVLVYAAGGAQGSSIARAVMAAGGKVRVLFRQSTVNPFGDAVDIVRGDLADPAGLRLANLGIDKVVLTLPNLPDPALVAQIGRNAIDAAKTAGVGLLVLNTSGPMASADSGAARIETRLGLEAYLRASGVPSIIVRPTLYMSNIAGPWSAPAIVHQGVLAQPFSADFPVSWISWEDMAAFMVEALKRPHFAGRAFNIGGPEALTGTTVAETLSTVIGRPISYIAVPLVDFAARLNAAFGIGVGDQTAAVYAWFQSQPVSPLAVDLKPALSELPIKPTSFIDWAKAQDWRRLAASERAA